MKHQMFQGQRSRFVLMGYGYLREDVELLHEFMRDLNISLLGTLNLQNLILLLLIVILRMQKIS